MSPLNNNAALIPTLRGESTFCIEAGRKQKLFQNNKGVRNGFAGIKKQTHIDQGTIL